MRLILLAILFAFAYRSYAAPFCPPTTSQIAGPREVTNFFFKTAIIGDADRRNLKDFAKESGESEADVAKRYAASGDLYCGDTFGQAQVVLKNDLIVTSAHLLYDGESCEKARDVKACKFYLMEKGKRVAYDVEREEGEGFVCPDNDSMKTRNDWAIIRLKKAVGPSVKPYPIKIAPCASEEKPADVILVAKSSDYGRIIGKPLYDAPRHYGRCQIMKGYCEKSYPVMESNCDIGPGSSGGGLFTGDKNPELVAINAALYKACPGSAPDKTGPYKQKCWSAASVPIAGELRDRLEKLSGQ